MHTLFELSLQAAQEKSKGGGGITSLLPIVLLMGVFWFAIMRPQQRRAKDQKMLLSQMKQGDKVIAAGGIVGTIRRVDDDTLSLQVADGVVIKVDRGSVSRRLTE